MNAFFILDLIGTAVFAYTGSVAAKQQRFHLLGVFYISFLTAVGGGTLRGILLQTPDLFWMSSSAYFIVISVVVLASYLVTINTNRLWFYLLDSQSLAVFVALGFSVTLAQGQALHIAFAMGVLSGIGGGLIRDAITSQPPQALSDPAYPLMMLAAAVGSLAAQKLGLQAWTLACLAVLLVVLVTTAINFFRTGTLVNYDRTTRRSSSGTKNTAEEVTVDNRRHETRQSNNGHHPEAQPGRDSKFTTGRKAKSGLMATVHAVGIIGLSCLAGFYYFNQSITDATANIAVSNTAIVTSSRPVITTPPVPVSIPDDEQLRYQGALNQIEELLAARKLSEAETLIAEAKSNRHANQDLVALEKSAGNLKAYLRTLDDAELALAANDTSALKEMLSIASGLGYSGHRLETLKLSLASSQQRETLKAENTRLARKSFNLHLTSAEHHFDRGNLDLAIVEIDMARSFGVDDRRLSELSLQIESERRFRSTPLSDADFAVATQKFSQLEQAIKHKNTQAIAVLTTGSPQRNDLFNGLFDRYVELTTSVSGVSSADGSKTISCTLALENMRLANGNLTYPSSSYGTIKLSIERTREGWSKIKW